MRYWWKYEIPRNLRQFFWWFVYLAMMSLIILFSLIPKVIVYRDRS